MKGARWLLFFFLISSGCQAPGELKLGWESLESKRVIAAQVIETRDFSVSGLLKAQEYFFGFAEQANLAQSEPGLALNLPTSADPAGVRDFCGKFILSRHLWQALESECARGSRYRCSPDIQAYPELLKELLARASSEFRALFRSEPLCFTM